MDLPEVGCVMLQPTQVDLGLIFGRRGTAQPPTGVDDEYMFESDELRVEWCFWFTLVETDGCVLTLDDARVLFESPEFDSESDMFLMSTGGKQCIISWSTKFSRVVDMILESNRGKHSVVSCSEKFFSPTVVLAMLEDLCIMLSFTVVAGSVVFGTIEHICGVVLVVIEVSVSETMLSALIDDLTF